MSLFQMYKKCPKCKKRYPWNPAVGQMWCPDCGPSSIPGMGDLPMQDKKSPLYGKKIKLEEMN